MPITVPKRLLTIALAMLVALSLSVVFAEEGEPGGTLRVGYHEPLANLDVQAQTGTRDEILQMVFEPLITMDSALQPAPILADSWEVSDDEMTWTITLREGVEFHNGSPFTSDDVIASLDRYMEMGARTAEFDRIDSYEAVDDYTVAFHLSEPWAALPETFAMPSGAPVIHPREIIEELHDDVITDLEHLVGTGPYRVTELEPDELMRFERFENYSQPEGEPDGWAGQRHQYPDVIDILPIPDDATRAAVLFAGEVDVADRLPADDVARLDGDPNTQYEFVIPGRKVYLKMNSHEGPFADHTLREAVRTALDPEQATALLGPEGSYRANTAVRYQENQWMWDESITRPYYEADLDRARELVEESDYDGERIRYMITPDTPDSVNIAPVVLETLQDIGLNAEIISYDVATFRDVRTDHSEWEIKAATGGSVVPLSYLDASFRDRNGEYWPWVPVDEVEELLDIIATDLDQDARQDAVNELNRINVEAAGELWLGEAFPVLGARDHVRNLTNWHYMRLFDIWLDN